LNNLANKINLELKELDEVKTYLALKETIKNDEQINDLLKKIEEAQKEMKKYASENDNKNYLVCKKQVEKYKEEFYSNPLIVNYMAYKEETLNIIEQMTMILSDN